MATVFFKGKQWIAQWYRPDGSRVKRGTGCAQKTAAKRDAAEMEARDRKAKDANGQVFEAILSRAVADAKAGKLSGDRGAEYLDELRKIADPGFKRVSLAAHLAGWIEEKTGRVKPKTTAAHRHMLRRMKDALGPAAMKAPVADLTRPQIESALRKLKAPPADLTRPPISPARKKRKTQCLKSATINLDLGILRQALKQALEDGLILKNPAAGIKALPQTDSTVRAPFEAAEVRQLIDHPKTSDEWRGMILFGAHTGLRLGDVAALGRPHIDGSDLVIRPKKTERSGKTIRIPLTPPLLAWIGERQGLFFPRAASVQIATLSTQFPRIMARAGVPAAVTLPGGIPARRSFHSLRHSFTSWLAEADIHADIRQKLTGHSSSSSHARYTHHDAALARAIATLPEITVEKRA